MKLTKIYSLDVRKIIYAALEGIFYDGQIFDAFKFACDLIKSAKKSIVLIDNYIDVDSLQIKMQMLSPIP